MKDKTGLGMSWGRAPKDGRGPKVLKSIWRDWQEAEDFATRFEVLTVEDIERREIERERASRYVSLTRARPLGKTFSDTLHYFQTTKEGDEQISSNRKTKTMNRVIYALLCRGCTWTHLLALILAGEKVAQYRRLPSAIYLSFTSHNDTDSCQADGITVSGSYSFPAHLGGFERNL
jgi:hypothetical protein